MRRCPITTFIQACAAVLLCGALVGCASLHLTQDPDTIWIRDGDLNTSEPAGPYAAAILPYALLAYRAYDDVRAASTPPIQRETPESPLGRVADTWLNGQKWHLRYGREWDAVNKASPPFPDDPPLTCPGDRLVCFPIKGLGIQIWMRQDLPQDACSEVAIAFRGTDFRSSGDWFSNFRWVTRILPLYDQYDQVRFLTPSLVNAITALPCFRPDATTIISVGHSLGGGLAQQAAYMDGRIRRVYAFHSSTVTGYYSVDEAIRNQNEIGLEINRIYEHGEVLAYLRLVMSYLYPVDALNPRIRVLRLNLLDGNIIAQHSLADFILNLASCAESSGVAIGAVVKSAAIDAKPSKACAPSAQNRVAVKYP